jgi:hypothetical protein
MDKCSSHHRWARTLGRASPGRAPPGTANHTSGLDFSASLEGWRSARQASSGFTVLTGTVPSKLRWVWSGSDEGSEQANMARPAVIDLTKQRDLPDHVPCRIPSGALPR